MTKYILHGGAAKKDTIANKNFFFEIANNLPDSNNILIVCYAKEKDSWQEELGKDRHRFFSAAPQKAFDLILADENASVFIEQIKQADAIYMCGGNTSILKKYLEKISNLENLWKDKIVAGSSAGALVLAKYYYENDDDAYDKGLGILPLKIICHYTEELADKLERLKRYGGKFEVRVIPEEKFLIIER
ncbi:MAG: Type 1 glutamine amidotransferase-like domain-containing protein [Patescibacteria group bacterium]|jgi:peptidase E